MIKPELYWLTLTVAFTAVLWVPYVVNRFVELGRPTLKWFPAADPAHRAAWANRNAKAHVNAVENLVLFAPLAVTSFLLGGSSVTAMACKMFFFARVAHAIASIFGMPIPFRTVPFLVGFGCQMVLVVSILSHV